MQRPPLQHLVRIRRSDDLRFMRPGLMDEVVINANHLENSSDSTTTALRHTTLPFTVDPVLSRFQVPEWWRNEKGETKKNYTRLGAIYVKGTSIQIAAGPLLQTVPNDQEWRTLARNVINYQLNRLEPATTQLDFLTDEPPRELRPARLMAPGLVAFTTAEDRINRLLAEASAELATLPLAVQVIVPLDRLLDPDEVRRLLATVATDEVDSYLIWTPNVTEERMLNDHEVFGAVLRLVAGLVDRGVRVGYLHASYTIAALHQLGVDTVIHHLGWVDKGEPVDEHRGGLRSCQTYVPGVRHSIRFERAYELGRGLDAAAYTERYCDCDLCTGTFDAGQHPLDLLLEDQVIRFRNGQDRLTPTSRAVELNTWHYLLSRQQEVDAFSAHPAVDVLARDIDRAAALAGGRESDRLRRLVAELRSA